MWRTGCLVALFVSPIPLCADLAPQGKIPYNVQVVLRFESHPVLTKLFRDRVRRELAEHLRLALGKWGQVDVVDNHEHWPEIRQQGLPNLGSWKTVGNFKTYFLLIGYERDLYVIRSRQYDGLTAFAGPLRRVEIADRLLVSRRATLTIQRDFGLVGTVMSHADGMADVELKAGQLNRFDSRWLQKNDLFAVVQIRKSEEKETAEPVPYCLLQVEQVFPEKGTCRCRVLQRYRDSLGEAPGLLGFRCIKLGTIRNAVRLRLVDDRLRPLAGFQVLFFRSSFDVEPVEETTTGANGMASSTKRFDGLVLVQVKNGGVVLARFPLALVDGGLHICRIRDHPEAEQLGRLELQKKQWIAHLYENVLVVNGLYKELSQLVDGQKHKEALARAESGLAELNRQIAGRTKEHERLQAAAKQLGLSARLDLSEGFDRLRELQKRRTEIEGFIANLRDVIKRENDPKRAEWIALLEKARLLEADAEYDEALKLYERIQREAREHAGILAQAKKRWAALANAWNARNEEHRSARRFIYETWRTLKTAAELNQYLDQAKQMFEICRRNDDRLTPRMLLRANLRHAARLQQRLQSLRPQDNQEDRQEAEQIAAAAEKLGKLTLAVTEFLKAPK
ncbi:MAG: hypothetical protein KatS3mg105_1204 [Gemmatales bacterium]|nr:MAG: hypothetical protein KatS3mg105_1204 [Gemmatales bacterium]